MELTNDVLMKLAAPFPDEDLEWRIMQAGKNAKGLWAKCVAYVTNRAIMNRLDEVVGPGNWRNECPKEWAMGSPGVLAGISIKIGGEWVTKWDGADQPDTEPVKGGFSNAMKRAAVLWGIGRDLYSRQESWADINEDGEHFQPANDKKGIPSFRWNAPVIGKPALRRAQEPALASISTQERPVPPKRSGTPPTAILPGKPTSWDNWGGKPMKDVPTDVLTKFTSWVIKNDKEELNGHVRVAEDIIRGRLEGQSFDEMPQALVPPDRDDNPLPF